MSKEKHYNTIVSPVITEKSTMASENNQVVFNVAKTATKPQIKAAIEYTAQDLGLDMNAQGAGIINASAAVSLEHAPPVAFIHDLIGVEYR